MILLILLKFSKRFSFFFVLFTKKLEKIIFIKMPDGLDFCQIGRNSEILKLSIYLVL